MPVKREIGPWPIPRSLALSLCLAKSLGSDTDTDTEQCRYYSEGSCYIHANVRRLMDRQIPERKQRCSGPPDFTRIQEKANVCGTLIWVNKTTLRCMNQHGLNTKHLGHGACSLHCVCPSCMQKRNAIEYDGD